MHMILNGKGSNWLWSMGTVLLPFLFNRLNPIQFLNKLFFALYIIVEQWGRNGGLLYTKCELIGGGSPRNSNTFSPTYQHMICKVSILYTCTPSYPSLQNNQILVRL